SANELTQQQRELVAFLCPPDDQPRQINDQPKSPPAAPWVAKLFVPPVMQAVASLSPPPDPRAHQHYDEYPPKKFYEIHEKEFVWQYHPDQPYRDGSWSWGFQSGTNAPCTPGPIYSARYGEPV